MKIKELTLGDVLKKEASQKTRKWIKSSSGSEVCGQSFVVDNELGGSFICLSNPENGRILIQSADCTISLQGFASIADLATAAGVEISAGANEKAINAALNGAKFGIVYIDCPTQ